MKSAVGLDQSRLRVGIPSVVLINDIVVVVIQFVFVRVVKTELDVVSFT